MGGEYGLLITFWKWRVKVVGNAIGLCVVNICAFGLNRIFELISAHVCFGTLLLEGMSNPFLCTLRNRDQIFLCF